MLEISSISRSELKLAEWTRSIQRSSLQAMLAQASSPDILSFALGLPAPELFPREELAIAAGKVLARGGEVLQYSPSFQPLKMQIVDLMAQRGILCHEKQIFLTMGAQQGMSLLVRLLLDVNSQVILDELAYTGFRQVIEPFRPRILSARVDAETGIDVDAIERLLDSGTRPVFIYIISDGSNPTGLSLGIEKRVRLVELARRYRVPIIEDDVYGFLYYDKSLPPMRAHDDEWILYVGSFSKILAPGLRVGWVIVPEHLVSKLSIVKEASDIDTSNFSQRVISAYLDSGHLDSHLDNLRKQYKSRRDAMVYSLQKHFPKGAKWVTPTSGVFVWVELEDDIDTIAALKHAIEAEQIVFIPGHAFAIDENARARRCMRLNFSYTSLERIEDGISRLGNVVKAMSS
jgi:2-aminoadipate transaminase